MAVIDVTHYFHIQHSNPFHTHMDINDSTFNIQHAQDTSTCVPYSPIAHSLPQRIFQHNVVIYYYPGTGMYVEFLYPVFCNE